MGLEPKLDLEGLRTADKSAFKKNKALVSLAMYGTAQSPLFAAIWAQGETRTGGQKLPVRKRTFVMDWTSSTITAHSLEKRYSTLVGITAWEYEQPRSIMVFEQFSKSATWPQVVTGDAASDIAKKIQFLPEDFYPGVVTGLDMCVQRVHEAPARQTYVAVIHPRPAQATMFNVQRVDLVSDKSDGLDSSGQHRAALRGWSRGHHAIPFPKNTSGGRRHAVVHYQDDTFKKWPDDIEEEFRCGTPIEGPLKLSQIANRVQNAKNLGYWPIRIGANGSGDHVRFFITWAPAGRFFPMKRYDVVVEGISSKQRWVKETRGDYEVTGGIAQAASVGVGPASLAGGAATEPAVQPDSNLQSVIVQLAKIDKLVFDAMHQQGAHAAQIAVAKDSKLKLVRSYTFAERNWPVTNAHHRMRMGSIAKLLMGMRASVAGEDFLNSPIMDLLPDLPLHPGYYAVLDKLEVLATTRVIDLLRYQSGWKDATTVYNQVLETVQRIPLREADFGLYTSNSNLDIIETLPATEQNYNNANFVAASEMLSQRVRLSAGEYIDLMLDYWRNVGEGELRDLAGVLPANRALCLLWGEPPVRANPGATLANAGGTVETAAGWPPPWVPSTYKWCADATFTAGSGFFTMSAVMLARILQGMCPTAIHPVKQLLTQEQRALMLQTNAVSMLAAEAEGPNTIEPGAYGAGASSLVMTFAGNPGTRKILKGGYVTAAAGRADAAHYVWGGPDAERHLSTVTVLTGFDKIDIQAPVEKLEELGYWDSEVNLFPEFFAT